MKNTSLNSYLFDKVQEIFSKEPQITMENFHRNHFVAHWPAGSPGFAGSQGEYMYNNNGDNVPSEAWDEDIVSFHNLKYVYEYFTKGRVSDMWAFISWMLASSKDYWHLWAYSNVHRQDSYDLSALYRRKYWKKASRRRVPKAVKRNFQKWFGGNKRLKEYYCFKNGLNGLMYAVKHPQYDFWVTEDGSVLSAEWGILHVKACTLSIR